MSETPNPNHCVRPIQFGKVAPSAGTDPAFGIIYINTSTAPWTEYHFIDGDWVLANASGQPSSGITGFEGSVASKDITIEYSEYTFFLDRSDGVEFQSTVPFTELVNVIVVVDGINIPPNHAGAKEPITYLQSTPGGNIRIIVNWPGESCTGFILIRGKRTCKVLEVISDTTPNP